MAKEKAKAKEIKEIKIDNAESTKELIRRKEAELKKVKGGK